VSSRQERSSYLDTGCTGTPIYLCPINTDFGHFKVAPPYPDERLEAEAERQQRIGLRGQADV
jgi:hypothetical protein